MIRFCHRLIFIRHGETDWNVEGRLQGQHDIPLNARGHGQAEAAGRTVGRIVGGAAARATLAAIASPLGRACRTMELARGALGLTPDIYATDDRLKELSFGRWEGLTWSEVKALAPDLAGLREADKWDFVPPGGESYAMLALRIEPWLAELRGDTLVVSHGGVARVLLALIAGVSEACAPHAAIWQGRVLVFESGGFVWV
ncbi:MAG TPA: histidine phosphatase family protein [Beijerinckiaceae bacterium]|jgi:probable phosphoglycerate mutase|nr:histidine phosphatase family protein [Beijerinckiaceae bacterium]